jgi:hypothetical protein
VAIELGCETTGSIAQTFEKDVTMNLDLPEQAASAAALMALVRTAADPKSTEARLGQLVSATRESDMIRVRAEKAVADADVAKRGAEAALSDLATRTSEFQAWHDGTRRKLDERAASTREENVARRERECGNREADIATRVAEHAAMMKRLHLHLAEFVQ